MQIILIIGLKVKSYLSNREQCVGWKGKLSTPKCLLVNPRVLYLDLYFFLYFFVNDYPSCLKYCHPTIYADDTSTDVCNNSEQIIEDKLTEDLLNFIA